ncbi:PAS domain S-box protein [Adhaeribacter radiodurans]|uniref:Sensory/regulatory protein RpfC n=1 Tax=Adhaeribacter radiodurans TaxID=2745197 RepID=A0A7L7L8W0_9BACT|nr:PAS domain S-box protein [Adhaeribacter radiodurans]QMU29260.1 PAS domain S-box protein [Adhaeribacter radiodurans]
MQTNLLETIQELKIKLAKAEQRNQLLSQQLTEKEFFVEEDNVPLENYRVPEPLYTYDTIFRQLFQESPEAMVILSLEDTILDVNSTFCSLLQYSKSELLQLNYYDVVDITDPKQIIFRQEKLRMGKFRGEMVLIRKDGSRFLADISSNKYLDQDGYFKFWGIIRDISKEREALIRSERDYRDLFNKANDAILIFDPETEQVFDANHKACKLYGFTHAEFIGMTLQRISKDVIRGKAYLQQLNRTGTLDNIESTQYRKDGTEIHLSISASFITYKGKKAVLTINHDITEKKIFEKTLLESEERFAAFMDNSPVLAWMKNTGDWCYSYVNQTHKHALGLSRELVTGKTDFELYPESIAAKLHQNDVLVAKNQRAMEYREEVILSDGTKGQFLVHKFPIHTINGDSFVAGTAINITDLLQTQRALENSEMRNRAVLNSAMDCIISMDKEGCILEFNPAAEKTFGYQRDEVIGKKIYEVIILSSLRSDYVPSLVRYLRTGKSKIMGKRVELTAKRANGEEFPVEVSITATGNTTDPVFTGIIQDISERKAAEFTLRKSEKQFRLITENMTDLVCLHEPDGKIIYASPSARDILGYTPEDMIDVSPYEFIHSKDKKRIIEKVIEILTTGKSAKNIEYRIRRKDGQYIWVDTGLRPIFNAGGKVIEVQTVSRDITIRKKTERKLKKAKEAAEISALAKKNFLANMSHEIRTPLNGVLGMAGLLNKTALHETQQKYLDIIDYSARNLLVIINDILDLAKIESGKLVLEYIPFNIHEILQGVQQALEYKAEEKDILLIVKSINLNHPFLVGDPHRLTQVLLNLVSNAIKFTNQGVVVIRTEIVAETDTTSTFQFLVKDSGIGIPVEKQATIFEGFMQAHAHTSRNYGGTGLGLTICKNLVEKQGGKIWVESELGKGSEFKFELTFQKAAAAQIKEVKSDGSPVDFTSLGSLKILLAEDNAVNQFLAQSIMQNWGFTVDTAQNGREAITLASQNYYDLILMDIQMPEVSGIEATQRIRQLVDTQKANIPIIALTANALKGDAEHFIAAGMNDYLAKPFEECKLFQKIAATIKQPSAVDASFTLNKTTSLAMSDFSAPEKLCNLTLLQSMANGNTDFLIKFLQMFIDQVPPQVQAMGQAVALLDWAKAANLAHQLKANYDTVGISALYQPIRDLEAYTKQQINLTDVPDLVANIENISNQAITELQAEIDRLQKQ